MRRDPLPWLLLLVLAMLGGVAWLTRHPDSPVLDRLTEWPLVGPAAGRFRQLYRPTPATAAGEEAPSRVVVIGRETRGPPPAAAARPLGRVWLRAGTELRLAPDPDSAVVATIEGLRTMTLAERRGDWRRVSRVGLRGSLTEGWVRKADVAEPSADELWRPEPVLPMAATPPAADLLAEARRLMGGDARELACGPFLLLTDVTGPLLERCPRLAGQIDRLYAERTGLEPVGGPAEAILAFSSHGAFVVFRTRLSPESRRQAFAAPARGVVALAVADRTLPQIEETLVHELVHLMNRRFLGPALPSWLDEGLAEELAISRIAEDATLQPDTLGRWQVGDGEVRLLGGGQVELGALRSVMRRGDLPTLEELVELDRPDFQAAERVHYSLSAFWVRYLLSAGSPRGGDGFRDFLAGVAEGQPLDEKLLLGSLGTDWRQLEIDFRGWLDQLPTAMDGRRSS